MSGSEENVRLKNVMQQKLRETKSKNTDVVLLLDSSGSVSSHDYNIGLEACEAIVKAMDRTKTQVGVLQFSSAVDVIHPINSDVSSALQNLTKARSTKSGGGTNTSDGLREAHKMLNSTGRADAVKVVWLFTDGCPNSQADAVAVGTSLRASNITIYGVGIGRVSKEQLEEVCGKETTFTIENYNILLTSIMSSELGSEITITIDQKKKSVKFAEKLPLDITIKNIGTGVVAKNSAIEFISGGFYAKDRKFINKTLGSGEATTVSIVLEPSGIASVDTLPEQILINVYKPNSDIPHQSDDGGFQIEMANLAGDLVDWSSGVPGYEKTRANIIVFGPVGQGKSSLVNSMISLTHRSYQQKALSLQSDKRVTTGTGYFGELAGFGFLDTQGAEEANYLNSEFSLLLKGALPIGYDVVQGETDVSRIVQEHEETASERKIHSCIFVASQTFRYLDKEDPSVLKMKQFIDDGKKFNLKPILAVTKMDEVQEEEVPKVRKEISALIGINPNDIFLITNPPTNANGDKHELKTEKFIYQLLWRALGAAKTFMAQEKEAEDNAKKAEKARKERKQAKEAEEKARLEAEEAEEKAQREEEEMKEQEKRKVKKIAEAESRRKSLLQEDELEELEEKLRQEEDHQRQQIEMRKKARDQFAKEREEQLRVEREAERMREEAKLKLQEIENQRLKDEMEANKRQLEREMEEKEAARRNQIEQERIQEEAKLRLQEIENQRLKDEMEAKKRRLEQDIEIAKKQLADEKEAERKREEEALRKKLADELKLQQKSAQSPLLYVFLVAIIALFIAILSKM